MNPAVVLSRLRRFLLLFSALMFVGALAELWLAEHTESFVQLIPFGLCALALASVMLALLRPRRAPLLVLRACAGLVILGSLYGVYEHFTNNIAFQKEIDPTAPTGDALMAALAAPNPLLAPGILAAAALLALAATYQHPALGNADDQQLESSPEDET